MSYFKKHKTLMYLGVGIILLLAIILPRLNSSQNQSTSEEYRPLVSVISVDDYSGNIKQIDTDATVESVNQVEIRAQVSSPVKSLNVGIGDKVYAGQVLLTLKNDDIYSQVAQAQANLDSAKAQLANTKKGTRSEEMAIYEQQYTNAERDMINAVRDAYTKIEDAAINKTDFLFNNSSSVNPTINVRTDGQKAERSINDKRFQLTEKLNAWKKIIETNDLAKEQVISDSIYFAKSYFDSLAAVINDLTPANSALSQTEIDAYKESVSGAQMQINAASSAYSGATSAWRVAKENLNLRKAGATTEQLALAEATVSQAEAALSGANSAYNKTVIVSPINGTVSVLPFRLGDLVTNGAVIVGVVNKEGLELKGYVSSDDASYVREGDKVVIDNKYNGQISRVSPSIDSQTKKVEVKVIVTDTNTNLIVGNISHIKIHSNGNNSFGQATTSVKYTLPIPAVNISNSGIFIYTLENLPENGTANSTSTASELKVVKAHEVKIGEVSGETVDIMSGVESGMNIIMPVVGIKDGGLVRVKN